MVEDGEWLGSAPANLIAKNNRVDQDGTRVAKAFMRMEQRLGQHLVAYVQRSSVPWRRIQASQILDRAGQLVPHFAHLFTSCGRHQGRQHSRERELRA
jgi:hypothetical protein